MRLSLSILVALLLYAGAVRAAEPPAYILIDVDNGQVIDRHASGTLWYPASLSKLMTAYVTFSALKEGRLELTSPVRVSDHALAQPPSKMGFPAGTVMTLDNALKMMLVKSANDIAMAVAETVGGNETAFVALMNEAAAKLGMNSTHYDNPHGLPDDGQLTTARDLAVLARAIWIDFPEYRSYFGIPAIASGKRVLHSMNRLLERYRGTNGMKTGFICASGFNLVASATRDDRTLIAVVLGATSWNELSERAASLLNEGFNEARFEELPDPALASFEGERANGPPMDMRQYGVCGKAPAAEGDDDASADPPLSALEPRFVLMDPVRVRTGGADPLPAAGAAIVPLPHLRPSLPLAVGGN